jgi:exonuclease I
MASNTSANGGTSISMTNEDVDAKTKRAAMLASAKRPSVLWIRQEQPEAVEAMQRRFPDANIHELIRFLSKQNYNVCKATEMYQNHLEWRQATLPIHFDSVNDTLATRKFYLLEDPDALDHPVLFYCLQRFKEWETRLRVSSGQS